MDQKDEHLTVLAREHAEALLETLRQAEVQIGRDRDTLRRITLQMSHRPAKPPMAIAREVFAAEVYLSDVIEKVEQFLGQWPMPSLPPLDLSDPPDIVFYNG